MGFFGKKKTNKDDAMGVTDVSRMSAQLEKARFEMAEKQKEYSSQCDLLAEQQQKHNQLTEECEVLRSQNKKRRKKAAIICILFLLLGIGANIGINVYADNEINQREILRQREFDEKKAVMEQEINENPNSEFSFQLRK